MTLTYQEKLRDEYTKQYAINWFKMNEGSGTTLKDSKGSAVGVINGATWLTSGGLSFDGTNDYIQTSNLALPLGEKSIYLKIQTTNIKTDYPRLFTNDTYANKTISSLSMQQQPNGQLAILVKRDNEEKYLMTPTIADGLIHEILITQSKKDGGDSYKLFVDNIFIQEVSTSRTEKLNASNIRFGCMLEGTNFFRGIIHEFSVFNVDIFQVFINKTLILHDNEYKKITTKKQYKKRELKLTTLGKNTVLLGDGKTVTFGSGDAENTAIVNFGRSSGKWYWEAEIKSVESTPYYPLLLMPSQTAIYAWQDGFGYIASYRDTDKGGYSYEKKVYKKTGVPLAGVGDRLAIAVDIDNKTASFYIKNALIESTSFTINTPIYPAVSAGNYGGGSISIYFDEADFLYSPPEGYLPYSADETTMEEEKIIEIVSFVTPTAIQFIEQGVDSLSPLLDRKVTTLSPQVINQDTAWSEGGKVFNESINLKKYFDIRSINITN